MRLALALALAALAGCGPDDTGVAREALEALIVQADRPRICTRSGRSVFTLETDASRLIVHVDGSVSRGLVHDLPRDVALLDRTAPPWTGGCDTPDALFALPATGEDAPVDRVEMGQLRWVPTDTAGRDTVELDVELFGIAATPGDPLRARGWSDVTAERDL